MTRGIRAMPFVIRAFATFGLAHRATAFAQHNAAAGIELVCGILNLATQVSYKSIDICFVCSRGCVSGQYSRQAIITALFTPSSGV